MLTTAAVRAARPLPRAYKRADGQRLYLHIAPTGTKSWRLRYRDADGREQTLTRGLWPEVSIEDARAWRDRANALIDAGDDPRAPATAQPRTFAEAARAWHAHRAPGWSTVHATDVLASLERDVFPAIGAMRLDAVTPPLVLALLEAVEARGAIQTARRVRQRVQMVYKFAIAKGWATIVDPTDVKVALANATGQRRQPALVDVAELVALRAGVEALDAAPVLKLAHRFLALTAMRLAAYRLMRWSEVLDLDGPAPVWGVPAAHMKLGVVKKADAENDHLVPLSAAAAAVLRAVRAVVYRASREPGPDDLVFPGRGKTGPIGKGALGELIDRAGFAGRHCPHGWRASFSTVLNEHHPETGHRAAIDQALGHAVSEEVSRREGAYNRAQHLARRHALFEEWAALIAPLAPNAAA